MNITNVLVEAVALVMWLPTKPCERKTDVMAISVLISSNDFSCDKHTTPRRQ